MIRQSEKMREVKLSRIRQIMEYCAVLEKQGRTIIDLTNGEPDFVTPSYIREAAKRALDEGKTGYAPTKGVEVLRAAIAKRMTEKEGLAYCADEILITNGVTQSVFLAMATFINQGDEVILPDPGYTIYPEIARFCGGIVKNYSLKRENGFQIDADELKSLITPKTRLILLLSPSNPIGASLSRESLEQIAGLVRGTDIIVISDEVYNRLTYSDTPYCSIASLEGMHGQTIVLNGFSKTYAMTGWRIGYIAAPADMVEPMMRLNAITTCGANNFVQYACVEAIEKETDECEQMRLSYESRIRRVTEEIRKIRGLSCDDPEGAFYVFIDIRKLGMTSEEFIKFMIDEASVALVPGSCFGSEGEGFVRICCAKRIEVLLEAVGRIRTAVEKYLDEREAN